jgi:hypothetical protein
MAAGEAFRWAGPSVRPRILVPFTGAATVEFACAVPHISAETRAALAVSVNDRSSEHRLEHDGQGFTLRFEARLREDRASLIELFAPPGDYYGHRLSLAMGDIAIFER